MSSTNSLSIQYLDYLHTGSLPDKARERKPHNKNRLTINETPFWQNQNIEKVVKNAFENKENIFVNVDLNPEDYKSYLQRTVPYAEKILLQDPFASLYELRDRGIVNKSQFHEVKEQLLDVILPLYPLVEADVISFIPEPCLWSNALDRKLSHYQSGLFENDKIINIALKDEDNGLNQEENIERWLEDHEVPDGWKENPSGYAKVSILTSTFSEFTNGMFLASVFNAHPTSRSLNTWNLMENIASLGIQKDEPQIEIISKILPLTNLPYPDDFEWEQLLDFRNNYFLTHKFRKYLSDTISEIESYDPNANNPIDFANKLSAMIQSEVDTLNNKNKELITKFLPTVMKSVAAGFSALIGAKPLAITFGFLSFFEAISNTRQYLLNKKELRKNPLFFLFK